MVLFCRKLVIDFVPARELEEQSSRRREVGLAERRKMGSKSGVKGMLYHREFILRKILYASNIDEVKYIWGR